jgi:hypothetical protein
MDLVVAASANDTVVGNAHACNDRRVVAVRECTTTDRHHVRILHGHVEGVR